MLGLVRSIWHEQQGEACQVTTVIEARPRCGTEAAGVGTRTVTTCRSDTGTVLVRVAMY
jgi:hypothetical protein